MNILAKDNYNYLVFENSEGVFIDVICGSVAYYTERLKLSDGEIAEFKKDPSIADRIANEVRDTPQKFSGRLTSSNFKAR
jgi:hypothetical protein